jgi:hypothetical protein
MRRRVARVSFAPGVSQLAANRFARFVVAGGPADLGGVGLKRPASRSARGVCHDRSPRNSPLAPFQKDHGGERASHIGSTWKEYELKRDLDQCVAGFNHNWQYKNCLSALFSPRSAKKIDHPRGN